MFSDEKKQGFKVLNGTDCSLHRGEIDLKSRLFSYFSVFLMVVVFVVIFLGSVGFFPSARQETGGILMNQLLLILGIIIDFFCVPILYWSSFDKFKKGDAFWDSELFWILPLFFFGSLSQYISGLFYIVISLPFSLALIFFVHIWVMMVSRKFISSDEQFENTVDYFNSITYLTAYYLIIVVGVVFFDLFEKFKYWVA